MTGGVNLSMTVIAGDGCRFAMASAVESPNTPAPIIMTLAGAGWRDWSADVFCSQLILSIGGKHLVALLTGYYAPFSTGVAFYRPHVYDPQSFGDNGGVSLDLRIYIPIGGRRPPGSTWIQCTLRTISACRSLRSCPLSWSYPQKSEH